MTDIPDPVFVVLLILLGGSRQQMLHGIVAGIGRDGALLADGLIRRADRNQILQVVGIDIAVGAHIVDDGPSVLELPDGNPRPGVQLHPVGLVILLLQRLLGHRLPDIAFPGHRGDVLVLLDIEGRRIHRIVGHEVLGQILPLDISQLALVPDDDPHQADIDHVHRGVLEIPDNGLGLRILLRVDAVGSDHVADLGFVQCRRVHVKIRQGLLMIDGVGIRHGNVLRILSLRVLLALDLLAGEGILILLRPRGRGNHGQPDHKGQQPRKHSPPESHILHLRFAPPA